MNRDSVQPTARVAAQQPLELPRVPHRVDAANGARGERLEQPPATRAHGEPAPAQVWPDGVEDTLGKAQPRSLQIQHELRRGGSRGEQLVQVQPRAPRRLELPAIPKDRQRPDRLQVADLEPAAEETDVSFDQRSAEAFRRPQVGEAVARAVRDEERGPPAGAEARCGLLTHGR